MSERVFVFQGRPSDAADLSVATHDHVEVVELAWSDRLEAFVTVGDETPLHLSDVGQVEGEWLIFTDSAAITTNEHALAVMLDYARYYGLRTAALFSPGGGIDNLRYESFALDAILAPNAEDADLLRGAWRAKNLDIVAAPPVITFSEGRDVSALLALLRRLPAVPALLLLEGAGDAADATLADCAAAGVAVRRLKWDETQAALQPIVGSPFPLARDFAGDWALLPLASCRDGAQAMDIVDEAIGLGFKIAIDVGDFALEGAYGRLPLQGADIIIFPNVEKRDAVLADAFRLDEKSALLRESWRVAANVESMIAEMGARRGKLNSPRLLNKPDKIHTLPATTRTHGLRAAIEGLGLSSETDALADTKAGANDWLLLSVDNEEPDYPSVVRQAKKHQKKIAIIIDAIGDEQASAAVDTLSNADVVLPMDWTGAARIIRALSLAGKTVPTIVPLAPSMDPHGGVDWNAYARNIIDILSRKAAAPGWPLAAIIREPDRPLLTCAITTYNRAPWLRHSLKSLLDAAAPWRDRIEILVCDNASTDDTPRVAEDILQSYEFSYHRNPENVGMLGNLGATARHCKGAYVWIIGDDDLVVAEGLEIILDSIEKHRDVEMVYLNYAFTRFNDPASLSDARRLIEGATPIGFGGASRYAARLADVAAFNENLFTAIYACVFRRDHALRAYQLDTRGAPFSSLPTCVPSSVYTLSALQDRPAFWIGFPAIVVNMNVSWMRWALLWHLERMPDLHDMAERAGVDPARIDRHRFKHCWNAGEWLKEALFDSEDPIRFGVSVARLIERCKHLEIFRTREGKKIMHAYRTAWDAGRIVADHDPPDELFARYGLALEPEIASAQEKL